VVNPHEIVNRERPGRSSPHASVRLEAAATPSATNERIVRLLEEVKAQLADSSEQQERIARDVTQLLERKSPEHRPTPGVVGWTSRPERSRGVDPILGRSRGSSACTHGAVACFRLLVSPACAVETAKGCIFDRP
jgi:hypothetical protein